MKFSCERCGKKYATAEDPAPGRVYKLKCKACGHLIVVKAAAAAAQAPTEQTGSVSLEIAMPEPATGPADGAPPPAFDATTEVSAPGMRGFPLEPQRRGEPSFEPSLEPPPMPQAEASPEPPLPAHETTPPPGESGYVDLFSDMGEGSEEPERSGDDPFLAAARASLPETYGAGTPGAPDPFAGLREDLSAASAPEPAARHASATPKLPDIPKPRQEKSNAPLFLIGGGVAVLVGILAFVMLSSGGKQQAAPAPAAVATPAPVAAPPVSVAAPEPAPAVPAQPAPAEPAPQAAPAREDDRKAEARAEQKRREREAANRERADRDAAARADREAKARAERDARDRAKAEREAAARADREAKAQRDRDAREAKARADADAKERERLARQQAAAEKASAEPEGGLSQAQIEGVLRSTKPAFDGCIQGARGTDVKLDGRRVMLRLNIQTSGTVTYPTLDDVTLNGTELGSCLKSAARLMVFPKFKGDTMHVEVPLVMR